MQKENTITVRQFILLLYVMFTAFTTLQSPGVLIYKADRDAWISVIIAWILDITLGILYAYMGTRFKGQSFVQYSDTIMGKYLGKIIGAVFPISFFIAIAIFLTSLATVITKAFLPDTSVAIVLACGYFVAGYTARKGIIALGRACEIAGPVFLLSMLALFIFIIPWVQIDHVQPILDSGIYPVVSGALYILSYLGVCIMMGMYIPICDRPQKGMKAKFIASTLGSTTMCILVIITVGTFGIHQAKNMFYPSLQVARIISIGNFIQRVEVVWLVVSIAAGIIGTSCLIWGASEGVSQLLKIKDSSSLVYSLCFLSFVLSITTFKNDQILREYIIYLFPVFPLIMTILEALLFVVAVIRKKRVTYE